MSQIRLNSSQRAFLARVAAVEDGFADVVDSDAKLISALVRKGLLVRQSTAGEPDQVRVTNEGRALLGLAAAPAPRRQGRRLPTVTAGAALAGGTAGQGPAGKLGVVLALLQRPAGATLEQLMGATGWQAHSVRGALAGALKKKRSLPVISVKTDAGRIYRLEDQASA